MCETCGCGEGGPASVHRVSNQHRGDHSHGPGTDYHLGHDHRHSNEHASQTSVTHIITVDENLLAKNNRIAAENRTLLGEQQIVAINLLSSPGAGKTTLLERTLQHFGDVIPTVVIEGDQQTDRDALRIAATGTAVAQVNTGLICHLDAEMTSRALHELPLDECRLLVIENVGNLICPSLFDLGEQHKVVLLSTSEGDDKPIKYPHMFRDADLVVINKIDLLPYVDFDLMECGQFLEQVNPGGEVLQLSAKTSEGMNVWYSWLKGKLANNADVVTADSSS